MASHQSHRGKDTIEIFVRNMLVPGKPNSWLVVKPTDTIYSIMAKMEDKTGLPPIMQRMSINCKTLYDYTPGTLADHGIGDLMVLQALYCVSGSTRLQEKTLKALGIVAVDDNAADSPDDDVEEEASAPPVRQAVDGRMRMAVADYMIPGRARTITLEVEAGDTVASVMEEVQRRRRYPVAMQLLLCDGTPMLSDGSATLADYNVTKDSKIELCMNINFAIAADRVERGFNKEIAADVEQQQHLANDKK